MAARGSEQRRTEAERDIAAAMAELRGRRDQVSTQYDERLSQLEQIREGLVAGSMESKVAQDRVRQLLGERQGIARGARAGRTTIGMSTPTSKPLTRPAPVRMGPTPTVTSAALGKALQDIDSRVGHLVAEIDAAAPVSADWVELALLRQLRRGVVRQQAELPQDALLLETILQHSEEVQASLQELEQGGPARAQRLVDYARELVAQLKALGKAPAGAKEQLVQAKVDLGKAADEGATTVVDQVLAVVVQVVGRAQPELERQLPVKSPSLLDRILAR